MSRRTPPVTVHLTWQEAHEVATALRVARAVRDAVGDADEVTARRRNGVVTRAQRKIMAAWDAAMDAAMDGAS